MKDCRLPICDCGYRDQSIGNRQSEIGNIVMGSSGHDTLELAQSGSQSNRGVADGLRRLARSEWCLPRDRCLSHKGHHDHRDRRPGTDPRFFSLGVGSGLSLLRFGLRFEFKGGQLKGNVNKLKPDPSA